jgi:Salmonella virulence plasmid 65kDa B protein/FG-GAP-like repeat
MLVSRVAPARDQAGQHDGAAFAEGRDRRSLRCLAKALAFVSGPSDVISLPNGGGALAGIGEKFAPDPHTGTGNFTVPLAVPPGRNGVQPQLDLVYSTGAGNGPFGLGWSLSLPGVTCQTAKGVPRYDEQVVYVLSGAEDLEPVVSDGAVTRYRPRIEGLFASIERHRGPGDSHWEVRSKDGLVSTYGTPGAFPDDPATVADPANRDRTYAWKITRAADTYGNHVAYDYQRDTGGAVDQPHHWDQLYVQRIRYGDYGADRANPQYLVSVTFEYDERPDPFSERRAGFEIRTRLRCARIVVRSHADAEHLVRTYALDYVDQLGRDSRPQPPNGVSLLARVRVIGQDGDTTESMPPLELGYSGFDPATRRFFEAQGSDLPGRALTDPDLELVDLSGNGLPDAVELNDTARRWRNRGDGRFDTPRPLPSPPAGVRLADPGVKLLDANGDGRADLMVTNAPLAGYFPMRADVGWDNRSFRRFRQAPSFDPSDPDVRLVDLDGDGVTDAIRSGTRMECFFNDPIEGWSRTRAVPRKALAAFPDLSFSDPRVRWADFTGDGLQDIAVVHDGRLGTTDLDAERTAVPVRLRAQPHPDRGRRRRRARRPGVCRR